MVGIQTLEGSSYNTQLVTTSPASDRAAIGSLDISVNYAPENHPNKGLEIRHLLSGKS